MKTIPLTLNCPGCGSSDVVYSCEPDCCFNHVCGDCLNSFQLQTRDLGYNLNDIVVSPRKRDSLAPTVPCARCQSLKLAGTEPDEAGKVQVVCLDCRAMLRIEFE